MPSDDYRLFRLENIVSLLTHFLVNQDTVPQMYQRIIEKAGREQFESVEKPAFDKHLLELSEQVAEIAREHKAQRGGE
jgi:hypothetical protein